MGAIHFGNLYGRTPVPFSACGEAWGSTIMVTGTSADVTCKTCIAAMSGKRDAEFFDSTSCGRVYSTRIDCSLAPG